MTIFINRDNWNEKKLKVINYVSVEQPYHQRNVFNTYVKNFITGYIISQSKGKTEMKRLVCCRLNTIDVNVNVYAQIINLE